MMYFIEGIQIPPLVFGLVLLTFAIPITDFLGKTKSGKLLQIKVFRLLFIWGYRLLGIACIIVSLYSAKNCPQGSIMNYKKNQIKLLEHNNVVEGIVLESQYTESAPIGWGVLYQFVAINPETKKQKTYWGGTGGPKDYYSELSPGDKITIIYYPPNPNISSEIRAFLNHPSHRYVFKEAGVLHLVDKYKDKYQVKDYGLTEWYDAQAEK